MGFSVTIMALLARLQVLIQQVSFLSLQIIFNPGCIIFNQVGIYLM